MQTYTKPRFILQKELIERISKISVTVEIHNIKDNEI